MRVRKWTKVTNLGPDLGQILNPNQMSNQNLGPDQSQFQKLGPGPSLDLGLPLNPHPDLDQDLVRGPKLAATTLETI